MNKEEHIGRYGSEAYAKRCEQTKKWSEEHPERIAAFTAERARKSGKHYNRTRIYNETGLQGERGRVRKKHANRYRPYKNIIAPESQIHHEWIPGTADYRGVALVEKDRHMHGIVDVIQVLKGEITLFTEAEVNGVI